MKKTLIIALGCIAVMFASCKKPVEPTPEPVDYSVNYLGNYLGSFTFTLTSMNNEPQTGLSFPIDSIRMDITKGEGSNVVVTTVTVDNESHQTTGIATAENVDFESVHLNIDKADQHYTFELDLKMEGAPIQNDTLGITGSFGGKGTFEFAGQVTVLNEVSGTLVGNLKKQ